MTDGRQTKLLHSFLKYGFKAHQVEVLHICEPSDLNTWEKYFIDVFDTFNSPNGLNLKAGGHSGGTLSEESKAKLRKPRTPEQCEIYRQSALKRPPVSEETREKFRNHMKGNKNLLGIRAVSKSIYAKDRDGVILYFTCVEDSAKIMGLHTTSIYNCLKRGVKTKGIAFSYTKEGLENILDCPSPKSKSWKILYTKDLEGNIVEHASLKDCRIFTGSSNYQIAKSIEDGYSNRGFQFSYSTQFKPMPALKRRVAPKYIRGTPVYSKDIHGCKSAYLSILHCAKITGVSDCAIENAARKGILSKGKYYFSFTPFI